MPDATGPGSPGPVGGPRHAAPDDDTGSAPVLHRTGHRARHRDRSWRSRPLARGSLLALALAVLVVAVALVPRLTADGDSATGATGTTPPPSATPTTASTTQPPSTSAATAAPADWLSAALPPSTDLAAAAVVREELVASGVPADRMSPAEAGVASGSLLAVVDPAPPGSRVVARFDRPGGGELLVVDPRPGEPTAEQLERRRSLAAALLANPTTGAGPGATAVLQSGEVDMRLLSLLAALAAREGVGIAGFPALPGEEASPTPARRVLVEAVGGAPLPADPEATDRLRSWLAAQQPPFGPDDVQVTDDGVLVSFRYVSAPDALVTDATS